MNVDGMTRENVASHLQKYRLYLKRLAGVPGANPIPQHLLDAVSYLTSLLRAHPPSLLAALLAPVLVLACVLGRSPFGTASHGACRPCCGPRTTLAGAGVQAVGAIVLAANGAGPSAHHAPSPVPPLSTPQVQEQAIRGHVIKAQGGANTCMQAAMGIGAMPTMGGLALPPAALMQAQAQQLALTGMGMGVGQLGAYGYGALQGAVPYGLMGGWPAGAVQQAQQQQQQVGLATKIACLLPA